MATCLMLSAFIALIVFMIFTEIVHLGSLPIAFVVVLVAAMALTALWNSAIERLAYRPLRGSFRFAPLISAIGMSIFLSILSRLLKGRATSPRPFAHYVFNLAVGGAYDVTSSMRQILIMIVTAVLLVAFSYLVQYFARPGAARCEQDRKMAALLGIDVDATISITFVIGAAWRRSRRHVRDLLRRREFRHGFVPGVKAFTAASSGGIDPLPGPCSAAS